MRCKWKDITEPDAKGFRRVQCVRPACGIKSAPTNQPHERIHCTCKVWGWGDYLAAGLQLIGITSQEISWLIGRDCGCARRQEALNTWGEWIQDKVRQLLRKRRGPSL